MPRFVEHLRDTLASKDPNEARFRAARAAREEANAKLAEIELDAKRGFYHRADDVEFFWTQTVTACKARILAVPSRICHALRGQTDLVKINGIITDELYAALEELSRFRVSKGDSEEFLRKQFFGDGPIDEQTRQKQLAEMRGC
jgi:hypothetical protein